MDMTALRAKGVVPIRSVPATLHGWRLRFNVEHFFRHEGGVGNIAPTDDPAARVLGVLHWCNDGDLVALDKLEARGVGYDRVSVELQTPNGAETGFAYVGLPEYVNDTCLPTRRYLNILLRGARNVGLDASYIAELEAHEILPPLDPPPFVPPHQSRLFDHNDLVAVRTALSGHLFDMTSARAAHRVAQDWFAAKDVTMFLLRRMDSSNGNETLNDVVTGRLNVNQRRYLDAYLKAFCEEYEYVGPFNYAGIPSAKLMG